MFLWELFEEEDPETDLGPEEEIDTPSETTEAVSSANAIDAESSAAATDDFLSYSFWLFDSSYFFDCCYCLFIFFNFND